MNRNFGRQDIYFRIMFILILLFMCLFYFRVKWLPRFPDPFGYLSNAAIISGLQWNNAAEAIQKIYAIGYSLILVPFFRICHSYVSLSKCILGINFCVLCFIYLVLCLIADYLFVDVLPIKMRSFLCFLICIYPANFYNVFTVTPELLSGFILSSICFFCIRYSRNLEFINILIATVLVSIMPIIHSRELVILCAFLIYLLYLLLQKKIRVSQFLACIVIMVIGLVIYKYLIDYLNTNVYNIISSESKKADPNSLNAQVNKLGYFFSIEGIKNFSKSLSSQFFYIQVSSAGIFCFGLFYCIREVYKDFKNTSNRQEDIYFFTCMYLVGMFILSAYYFIDPHRIDHFIYGRHIESTLSVVFLVSFKSIWEEKDYRSMCVPIILTMGASYLTFIRIAESAPTRSIPRTILGFELFYNNIIADFNWVLVVGKIGIFFGIIIGVIIFYKVKYCNVKYAVLGLFIVFIFWSGSSYGAIQREAEENKIVREPYLEILKLLDYDDKAIYTERCSYYYLIQVLAYNDGVNIVDLSDIDYLIKNNENILLYTEHDVDNKSFRQIDLNLYGKGKVWIYGDDYIEYAQEIGYKIF